MPPAVWRISRPGMGIGIAGGQILGISSKDSPKREPELGRESSDHSRLLYR